MRYRLSWGIVACIVVGLCLGSTGCARLGANLMRVIVGDERPAEYKGFEEQKVAVVCTYNGHAASEEGPCAILCQNVRYALGQNVKKIQMVSAAEVDRAIEASGERDVDLESIGDKVKANRLLAIDLSEYALRDGPTLYRGRCNVQVKVYDMSKQGEIVYQKEFLGFSFPRDGGVPSSDIAEVQFRKKFLETVSLKVATLFYPSDATADAALDATAAHF